MISNLIKWTNSKNSFSKLIRFKPVVVCHFWTFFAATKIRFSSETQNSRIEKRAKTGARLFWHGTRQFQHFWHGQPRREHLSSLPWSWAAIRRGGPFRLFRPKSGFFWREEKFKLLARRRCPKFRVWALTWKTLDKLFTKMWVFCLKLARASCAQKWRKFSFACLLTNFVATFRVCTFLK